MIPKGNQRGGGQQLATHLLNSYDNELIEIADLRGAVASDLHGAFAEWRAQSKATKCRKYLYSLSVNPDHRQGPFAREQYYDFIARVEKKLGLANQPRAVVFHTKQGRAHCHVVWSRIDTDKLKAVQLSNDHQSLRTVAQEFAKDHGITLPDSMSKNRGKDRFKDREKREDLSDKQQQERSGWTKQQHKDAITALWKENGTGQSFVQALEGSGYYLARGDKENPTYVVIDWCGEVHSLARRIEGAKTKDIKARLVDYPIDQLRSVAGAKEFSREQRDRKLQASAALTKDADAPQGLETRGQSREASIQYLIVAQLRPDLAEPRYRLGAILLAEDRAAEALPYLQEAVRLEPNLADAQVTLGWAFNRTGQAAEAIPHFEAALRQQSRDPAAHSGMGVALMALGRPEESIAHFEAVLQQFPNSAVAHFNLGSALEALGRLPEAAEQFAAVIKLQPDYPGAAEALARTRR